MSNAYPSVQVFFDRIAATLLMGLGGLMAGAVALVGA